MLILIETIVLCLVFTIMVYIMSKDPIKTLYNYPPKIQERVKSLSKYKNKIPTTKNMLVAKIGVSIFIIILVSLIMRYINGYTTFIDSFKASILIWTIINVYDALVLDCFWFCQSKKFVFEDTEDMIKEYHNYFFHIKESLIGEVIGTIVCILSSLLVVIL